MIRRLPTALSAAAIAAVVLAACNGTAAGPALTDPKAIVAAAITSTQAATSVHLDVTAAGTATIALPIAGGTGTSVDLTGTMASADIDFARPAAKATISVPAVLSFAGALIAVDGSAYLRTTLTGPLYEQSAAAAAPVDPTQAKAMIGSLGDLLSTPEVNLTKGEDIACGSKSCYTVSANLTAADLGTAATSALSGLPIDLAGATMRLTMRVEKDLPYHLAGVTAILSTPKNITVTIELTASKWDEPVSVSAPPPDQVKPTAS
jgi:hypothetical protein